MAEERSHIGTMNSDGKPAASTEEITEEAMSTVVRASEAGSKLSRSSRSSRMSASMAAATARAQAEASQTCISFVKKENAIKLDKIKLEMDHKLDKAKIEADLEVLQHAALAQAVVLDAAVVAFPVLVSQCLPTTNGDLPRSLEMDDSTLSMAPTSSGRVDSPTILRLHPLFAKPAHTHANLPLRFGRDSVHMQRMPKSSINLPQRFGRSRNTKPSSGLQCKMCRRAESPPSATLPQRFGKRNLLIRNPGTVFARTLQMPPLKD
ncbi:Pro-FMRFamide-related neuropeptide VF, partial [Clarias magur]